MFTDRLLSYFGAAIIGAIILVIAMVVAIHTHELSISFGKANSMATQSLHQYVQLPTCYSQSQCPWLDAPPALLPSLTLNYESECESVPPDGRVAIPTHAELNWVYLHSTTSHMCPNF